MGEEDWALIGRRIRAARTAAGMSVRELARRVGVAPSHVSQVERGIGSFSVATLYAVTRELAISLDSLFEPAKQAVPESPLDGSVVLRARNRPSITLKDGPRWERLTAQPEPGAEFLEVIYEPAPSPVVPEFSRHDGVEYGVVVSGVLTVQVGDDVTRLHPGDAIRVDSSRPHRYWNEGPETVRAIWFEARSDPGSPQRVP